MSTCSRREVLKVLAGGACACVTGTTAAMASGASKGQSSSGGFGLLYDATICTGCKACVTACSRANDLEPDTTLSDGKWQMPIDLNSRTKNIIKVWQDPEDPQHHSFAKHQCMHCLDPACVSACPFNALSKGKWGVVEWEGSLCIGCRYCEVACPFDVPKFEWDKFNPEIVKCELCRHRLEETIEPGCTEACPTGAVIFGNRANLLAEAKRRIAESPGRYFEDRVYGEYEDSGTQVLYLSAVPFDNLGFPDLPHESVAEYATSMHAILYHWMALPVATYAVLATIINQRWKHHQADAERDEAETGLPEQL